MRQGRSALTFAFGVLLFTISFFSLALCQGTYTAELRGQVTDNSGAMIPHARLTITADETGIAQTVTTDEAGRYIFTALRPATYTMRVEAKGFAPTVHKNIVLAVDQQATVSFELKPAATSESVEVVDTAPLLDTGGASLGTEVTNEFISRMPIENRDVTQLVYLSAGVTTLNNGGGYPYGTDFSSNGQRYGSAEFRLDGGLSTGPEQGEGATTNVSYVPSTEVIQEFKVQNNSFAAEFGSNGGTVVNVLMKSGTNKFHGSGWWFGQRTELNANDFFSNRAGVPRTDNTRDQFGGSLSGPIIKNKTFFLFDIEHVRQNNKNLISARVPTDLERKGDFSQTLAQNEDGNLVPVRIFNPFDNRNEFAGAVIPPGMINSIGQALANSYPEPTGPIDPVTQTNFNKATVITSPNTQFDIKIDHQWNERLHLMGRYSQAYSDYNQPGAFYDGIDSFTHTRNVVLEETWTISPSLLWTNRAGLDRYYQKGTSQHVDPTQFGLPSLYVNANGLTRMPYMPVDNYAGLDLQCCADTTNGHTQYVLASQMSWIHGKHAFKYGWEGRIFLNNFYQPDYPTGVFNFTKTITAQDPFGGSPPEFGNGLASMLLGFPQSGQINIKYGVENKSMQNAFYFQDDWKLTSKLSLSLGLRYEFSTPYSERHNRIQYSDFSGNSGISLNLNPTGDSELAALGVGAADLKGTTQFASSNNRHIPIDKNNWGPRLGFAYQIAQNTVLRGGAGLFYGLSTATNFQYSGTSFRKDAIIHFTNDGGLTQYATLDNPFPTLPPNTVPAPQGTAYGKLAEWGFANANDLGTLPDRNPEIYQWNIGVQHLLPWGIVLSADYSANRSTHLPYGYPTRNRDFLSAAARNKVIALAAAETLADPSNPVSASDLLNKLYPNPFQSMFVGPNAIFHEPDSNYNNDTIPLVNLLKPYPQFDGDFEGLPLTTASSWYNGLLVRFQKRPSHGLSFEGSYTYSHATDDSSYGANSWIFFGGSGLGQPQDLSNLKAERSIGANDTPHRFTLATVYDLPFGRSRAFGGDMNRWMDGFVGGWSVNALLTLQSGQPIPFAMANSRLWDGVQRPNITCNPLSGKSLHDIAMSNDPNANYFNPACFADPGDQVPGDAPRFSSNARGQGIKNLDLGLFKDFAVRENMKLELRAEFFNFTNSVRFATPYSAYGDPDNFGRVEGQANQPRHMQVAVRFEF